MCHYDIEVYTLHYILHIKVSVSLLLVQKHFSLCFQQMANIFQIVPRSVVFCYFISNSVNSSVFDFTRNQRRLFLAMVVANIGIHTILHHVLLFVDVFWFRVQLPIVGDIGSISNGVSYFVIFLFYFTILLAFYAGKLFNILPSFLLCHYVEIAAITGVFADGNFPDPTCLRHHRDFLDWLVNLYILFTVKRDFNEFIVGNKFGTSYPGGTCSVRKQFESTRAYNHNVMFLETASIVQPGSLSSTNIWPKYHYNQRCFVQYVPSMQFLCVLFCSQSYFQLPEVWEIAVKLEFIRLGILAMFNKVLKLKMVKLDDDFLLFDACRADYFSTE